MNSSKKDFMSLSREECQTAGVRLMKNAKDKVKDAELLAKNNSYGTASSLLITGMEESIKSMFLALDSNGFQFRSRVKGIKSLFNQHGLRYEIAFILSIVNVFARDFIHLGRNLEAAAQLKIDTERVIRWFKVKIHMIEKEIEWFEAIKLYREGGLYYDINTSIIEPENIGEREFLLVHQRVKSILKFVDYLLFITVDDNIQSDFKDLQKKFFTEKWYQKLNEHVKNVNSNKGPLFENVNEFVQDFKEVFEDPDSIRFMDINFKKFNKLIHNRQIKK